MTHPLTPREKVEQAVKGAIREDASVGLQMTLTPRFMRGLVDRVLAATSVVDHETGFVSDKSSALASGSGDHAELARLKAAMSKSNDEICQSLGKALGYPWFKDDQRNFPGATEGNGVCVGDHVAESIADEAASRISAILAENAALRAERDEWRDTAFKARSSNTRAERKLAETVGLLRDSLAPGSFEGETEISTRIRTFLSKEAERG